MRPLQDGSYRTVPGDFYGTPKEIWGFRKHAGAGRAERRARTFLSANRKLLGLQGLLTTLTKRAELISVGATHVILQQKYRGVPVHRGFVTVHLSRDSFVYLVKSRAVPRTHLGGEPGFRVAPAAAQRAALDELGVTAADTEFVGKPEKRWYPLGEVLRPALRVRVGLPFEDWIVYVDGRDGSIIRTYDNASFARARARVFDPNPVVRLGDYRRLLDGNRVLTPTFAKYPQAYTRVALDTASDGTLRGPRVTMTATQPSVRATNGRLEFESDERGFAEVMAYYHLDRAVRHVEGLGYVGERAIFAAPLVVDAHAWSADQSVYDPATQQLSFGTGIVQDAEDGETVLHEFGHALQDAICPDFGQSYEAAAMGEGFGDYLAASFFASRKKSLRRDYEVSVMTWDGIVFDDNVPPCVRRVDTRAGYAAFVHREGWEHDNGTIWSATLWDIRESLGRRAADRIIVESHFQQDAFTRFDRGARAILDADRNLYRGRHVARLRRIFESRDIGPVA